MPESRSQILFLAHRVPYPPNRGDRIRSYHLIQFLAERADVHLAFLSDEEVPHETDSALGRLCKQVTHVRRDRVKRWINGATSLARGRTATEGLFHSDELRCRLVTWAKKSRFDVVFVFCSSMVQYLRTPGLENVPAVVDLVDVDSQKWFDYAERMWGPKRWLLRTEGRRLRRLERSLPDEAETITVVTPQEADVFQSFRPDYRPQVLRNGVDLEYFRPEPVSAPQLTTGNSQLSTVFVGALDYQANVDGAAWFCTEVWPQVRDRFPNARFRLVGSRPSAKVIRLGKLHGVDLVGEVSDVRRYLHEATVVTVPLRVARGVQNKVLEALAAVKPVVVTPQGLEGIGATPGRHLICATTPEEWIQQLELLFEDAELRMRLAVSGREFVERNYRWSNQLEKLLELPALDRLNAPDQVSNPACFHGTRLREIS